VIPNGSPFPSFNRLCGRRVNHSATRYPRLAALPGPIMYCRVWQTLPLCPRRLFCLAPTNWCRADLRRSYPKRILGCWVTNDFVEVPTERLLSA